jgi:hypothetical protein
MSNSYWLNQIEQVKAQIDNYNAAILFVTANPTESYKLDTGQTEQEVKRHNLKNMQDVLDSLYNRLNTLEMRCDLTPTIFVPAW